MNLFFGLLNRLDLLDELEERRAQRARERGRHAKVHKVGLRMRAALREAGLVDDRNQFHEGVFHLDPNLETLARTERWRNLERGPGTTSADIQSWLNRIIPPLRGRTRHRRDAEALLSDFYTAYYYLKDLCVCPAGVRPAARSCGRDAAEPVNRNETAGSRD